MDNGDRSMRITAGHRWDAVIDAIARDVRVMDEPLAPTEGGHGWSEELLLRFLAGLQRMQAERFQRPSDATSMGPSLTLIAV